MTTPTEQSPAPHRYSQKIACSSETSPGGTPPRRRRERGGWGQSGTYKRTASEKTGRGAGAPRGRGHPREVGARLPIFGGGTEENAAYKRGVGREPREAASAADMVSPATILLHRNSRHLMDCIRKNRGNPHGKKVQNNYMEELQAMHHELAN